mgnify:FL=1
MANPSPIRMSTDPELLKVNAGSSASLILKLRMATNWHVNSNMPGNEYAIPISFQTLTDGVVITPEWPEGETLMSAGEMVNVFGGVVEIPLTISTSAQVNGPIKISVTWQACNADTCLEPETNRIPGTISVE